MSGHTGASTLLWIPSRPCDIGVMPGFYLEVSDEEAYLWRADGAIDVTDSERDQAEYGRQREAELHALL